MNAVTRHDIGSAAKNARRVVLHVHQVEKPEFPFLVVEKQVNVGILMRVIARGRAEQVKLLHAEPLQLGFVLFELGYGLVAIHVAIVAEFGRPRTKGEGSPLCWLGQALQAGAAPGSRRGRPLRPACQEGPRSKSECKLSAPWHWAPAGRCDKPSDKRAGDRDPASARFP